jgi:Cellulose binding domain
MTDPAQGRPPGLGRHGRAAPAGGRLRSALVRYRWHAVALAGAGAAALAVGAFLLVNGQDGRLVASDCGLVSCSAVRAGGTSASAAPQGSPRGKVPARSAPVHHRARTVATRSPSGSPPAKPSPSRSPSRPAPSPTPTPSATPTPTTVSATVSYTLDQRWPGGFQGHFTIVNTGTAPLTGWALTATLPGDQIDSVWSASYTVSGNQLTLTAPSSQPAIAPGASQSAYFTASGGTAKPTGCVFNSQTCSG